MSCINTWRKWIRQVIMAIYTMLLIVAIVLISIDLDARKAETNVWGWFVGGLFVLFSLPISLWGILQHVTHFTKPFLQRREIRIMWMVPIYAADSTIVPVLCHIGNLTLFTVQLSTNRWLALRFPNAAIYLDTMRECYEAYVIYNFMTYLLAYLWENYPFLDRDLSTQPDIKLTFPLCWLKPWNGKKFLNRCKHGVLQYTLVRPVTTVIALICELSGAYHDGEFRSDGAWVYLVFINSISQTWALYCLVLFYENMKEKLQPMNPFKKFLCIKFVIFLSFWQAVVIAVLVSVGVIKQQADWVVYDTNKVAAGIQDFAICIEMFFAAIAHYFSFPHRPYIDPNQERNVGNFFSSLRSMFDLDDVTDDVRDHVRVVGKTLGVRVPGYGSSSDRVPLIRYSRDSGDVEDSFGVSFDYKPRTSAHDTDSLRNYADFTASQSNTHSLTTSTSRPTTSGTSSKDNIETTHKNQNAQIYIPAGAAPDVADSSSDDEVIT